MNKSTAIAIALIISTFCASAQASTSKMYLSISHEIKNYDSWKAVFDKFDSQRKEAGILDLFIKKDINNANSITVFSEITDLEKAKAFMSSNTLKEAMKDAGVTSPPSIVFYKSAMDYGTLNTSTLITIITHSVKDFSTWKKVYESADQLRKQEGIQDYLVLKSLSDENVITVIGSTKSAASFNKFMSNPDLKSTMEKAGVTSKPDLKILL